ncbi:MAG: hypothetical protein K0S47_3489 [Herbinix sp.]|nr:hypothetical protein [Herbinix sp.]
MENDRNDEYKISLEESEAYPEELNHIDLRLKKRIHRKIRKNFMSGIASAAAAFLLFVLVVNTPTAMADAILNMPVLGTLAEYVCFDKGLQNAVMNEYATELDLIEQDQGYSLGIPYVIADSKRLVVIFKPSDNARNKEDDIIRIDITKIIDTSTGELYEGYSSSTSYYTSSEDEEMKELNYTSIRSVDPPLPKDFQLYITMSRESFLQGNEVKESQTSNLFEPSPNTQLEQLGQFVFDLHLGNYPEPRVTVLNQDIEVEGQTICINSVSEYPTGTEISVTFYDDNDSIINGLNIEAIDNKGEEWRNTGGAISSGPDKDNQILYYLEGDYFGSSTLDKIKITGIRLIKKTEAEITLDLQNKTMTPQIRDVTIKSIEKAGNKACR